MRAVLDVLDDIRRHYRIDPDRTYLAGFSGGAEVACRIAFALPELFGGVICLSGDVPLPVLDHLRRRAVERLSIALSAGSDDRARRQQEKYLAPLLHNLGIRSRRWIAPDHGHELPSAATLAQVQRWLEDDLKRRQTDRRERIGPGEAPLSRELADRALEQALQELRHSDRLHWGAAQLQWLAQRWPRTESGEKAAGLLADLRADPDRGKILAAQASASRRTFLTAQARPLEQVGRLEAARRAWEQVARLAGTDEAKKASQEAKRLAALGSAIALPGGDLCRRHDRCRRRGGGRSRVPGGNPRRRPAAAGGNRESDHPGRSSRADPHRQAWRRPAADPARAGKGMSLVVTVGSPPREEGTP